jgi:hypothetical protein
MKKIVYSIFGKPIPKSKGVRGTYSGKLVIDKKVFFKRDDVKRTIEDIKRSNLQLTP